MGRASNLLARSPRYGKRRPHVAPLAIFTLLILWQPASGPAAVAVTSPATLPSATPIGVAAGSDAGPEVRWTGDRLTVHATAEPLARVLDVIASTTGIEVRGNVPAAEVTVALDDVPLATALETILRDQSFILRYGSDGALRAIDLLGGGRPAAIAASPIVAPSPAHSASPRSLEDEERQAAVLQRRVHVSARVAAALGTDTPTAGDLVHTALGNDDAGIRASMREAILTAFATDPDLEAAYLSTLTPVADATLASMFRRMARGTAAEELMTALASRAPSQELRHKAGAILAELRKLPPR